MPGYFFCTLNKYIPTELVFSLHARIRLQKHWTWLAYIKVWCRYLLCRKRFFCYKNLFVTIAKRYKIKGSKMQLFDFKKPKTVVIFLLRHKLLLIQWLFESWLKNILVRPTLKFINYEGRTYDHVHNIFRLFDDWANFSFTTSETKHDYY